jgi:hypothetical protein
VIYSIYNHITDDNDDVYDDDDEVADDENDDNKSIADTYTI